MSGPNSAMSNSIYTIYLIWFLVYIIKDIKSTNSCCDISIYLILFKKFSTKNVPRIFQFSPQFLSQKQTSKIWFEFLLSNARNTLIVCSLYRRKEFFTCIYIHLVPKGMLLLSDYGNYAWLEFQIWWHTWMYGNVFRTLYFVLNIAYKEL